MIAADTITTARLVLSALAVEDADDMVTVLADERIHEYIGGEPSTLEQLRRRYTDLAAGSGRPDEVWLNWIVRRRSDNAAVGHLQATVATAGNWRSAEVAWVIGVAAQGQGFASEAAQGLVGWLWQHRTDEVVAHVHPDHQASKVVAARAGLEPTDEVVDGETVWRATAAAEG